MANISMEEQINAIHRSQGLVDDDSAANRIGPTALKPTTSSHSSAKTIQKPAQLSFVAKPIVSMPPAPQRTLVAAPMLPRQGIQQVTILPQTGHTMVAMPSMMTVAPQPPIHPPPMIDEPSSKRSKTEDQLIPEEEFYKTYGRVRPIFNDVPI